MKPRFGSNRAHGKFTANPHHPWVGRVRCEEADEASDLERIFSLMPLGIQTQAEGLCRESPDLIAAALLVVGIRRGND